MVLITAGSDPPCKQNAPYYTRAMLIAELGVGNSPIFEEKKKRICVDKPTCLSELCYALPVTVQTCSRTVTCL